MRHAILYSLPVVASLGAAYAQSADVSTVCEEIAAAISSASEVFYPGAHWHGYALLHLPDIARVQRTGASPLPTFIGCPRAPSSRLAQLSLALLRM